MTDTAPTIRDQAEDALAAWEGEVGPLTPRECTAFRIGYLTGCADECRRDTALWVEAASVGRMFL